MPGDSWVGTLAVTAGALPVLRRRSAAPTQPPRPGSRRPLPATGLPASGEDPTGGRVYLASIERIGVRSLSDAPAVDMAYELCGRAAGGGPAELDRYVSDHVDAVSTDRPPSPALTIGSYCPEHMDQLR